MLVSEIDLINTDTFTTRLVSSTNKTSRIHNHQSMAIIPSRLTLRPFKLTDVDDLMTWASDDRVTRQLRWKTCTSKEQALCFIKDVCIPHPWRRSICIDDRSIGFVSIFRGSGENQHSADIGYAVAAEYWGHGIATLAVRMAVLEVFREDYIDLIRLQAFVGVDHKASQRVLEKCGFVNEGLLRKYSYLKGEIKDVYVYSILSSDLPAIAA